MPTSLSLKTSVKGRFFEAMARLYLRTKGYQILAKNTRTAGVEADILALHQKTLVVVEVKYRKSKAQAHTAIHPKQKERLLRHAQQLASRYPQVEGVRLDAVLFFPHAPFVECYKDAL